MQPSNQQQQQPQPSAQHALEINAFQQQQQQHHLDVKALEIPPQDSYKNIVASKIKEIDDQLDHGMYKCFHIYMCICLFLGVVSIILHLVYSTRYATQAITIWLPVLVAVWFLLQYIFEIAAFRKRRHGLANIAICLFVVNFLLLVLAVALIAVSYHSFMSYENLYGDDEVFRLVKKILVIALIHFVVLSALQIFINLPGSIKTRGLLKARRSLEITSTGVRIECYQV